VFQHGEHATRALRIVDRLAARGTSH
jgi:hypothetical protein